MRRAFGWMLALVVASVMVAATTRAAEFEVERLAAPESICDQVIFYYDARADFTTFINLRNTSNDELTVSVNASFFGRRRATDDNVLRAARPYSLPGYALLGATVSTAGLRLFGDRPVVVSLHGTNLLDTKTPDPGFAGVDYPRSPRTLSLELRQEL